MTSSNTLKKLVSIGAAMLLALGGSLVAAEPASAAACSGTCAVTWDAGTGGTMDNGQQTKVTTWSVMSTHAYEVATKSGCSVDYWIESGSGSFYQVSTATFLVMSQNDFTMTAHWVCPPVLTTAPTALVSGSSAIATVGIWASGTVEGKWLVCGQSVTAGSNMSSSFNSNASGCEFLYSSNQGSTFATSATLDLTRTYYRAGNQLAALANAKLVWIETATVGMASGFANTGHVSISAANLVSQTTSTSTSTTTVISEAAKPLPVWAAPILKAIPTLSKTLTTAGGKIGLTDGDFSSLKSVTIGGAAVAFSIDAKGDVNIPVPAGKGGTTADLIVTFTGGKMTIQEGIKYVEPVNVAAVREAPIAGFKGKSTKITGALAESIQYAAQLDKKATTVLCTGYAASKAVLALATARAEAACAYATKANDLLVNKTVKVVVNAKLAKTAAVGIKVHK